MASMAVGGVGHCLPVTTIALQSLREVLRRRKRYRGDRPRVGQSDVSSEECHDMRVGPRALLAEQPRGSRVRLINIKGDLFATAFSFAAQGVIKLGSSLILTRILRPEAYGIITILMSIVFVVEMLADLAVTAALVRHERGGEPDYLNTAWTMRLCRALLNSAVVFFFAPWISSLYSVPQLVAPLRVFSLWFIIAALESMSFTLAIRRKNSRIIVYSELTATLVATLFTVTYCLYSRDYWGMVYGTLVNRLTVTVMSYVFYREDRPKLCFSRKAARELLKYTRFAMPSSLLTLGLSQFDKMTFLRLFNLHLLGVYGLAGSIDAPIESLVSKISQLVLYPRCAHNFRLSRESFALKYYTENTKLFFSILLVPAAVGGAAHTIIAVLYDPRYAEAGMILQAFMLRAVLQSLAQPAEDLLIAAGEFQVILVGNVFRAVSLVGGALGGYYLFGFMGFTYGAVLSSLPPLIYYLWLQKRKGFLIARYEFLKFGFVIAVALVAHLTSDLFLTLFPSVRIRIRI
jgi:lipopolysaccharide exporter